MAKRARSKSLDGMEFANKAIIQIIESGANTLTFQRLVTGVAIFERTAFNIHRLGWHIAPASRNLILAEADSMTVALTTSDQISSLAITDANIPFFRTWGADFQGTPANHFPITTPDWEDFNDLPGGGIILPATNLFGAVLGSSLASAVTATLVLWYTPLELEPSEYWELVEATRVLSAP